MNRPIALAPLVMLGCVAEPPPPDDVLDVRVAIPEPEAGKLDYVGPELVVEPGKDVMNCTWLEPLAEDTVVSFLDAQQGRYGHHVIVLSSVDQEPAGTTRDCSSNEAMASFKIDILPTLEILPTQGIKLRAGTQLVFQSHYVNATQQPLLTRDVIRLSLRPEEQVEEWVTTFTTVELELDLPPGETTSTSFDCELPYDAKLQLVGGHMHEEGSRFQVLAGPDADNLSNVYLVDPWQSRFRDTPPIEIYGENPLLLPQGSIVRTSCEWHNGKQETLHFPGEMCSAFGYIAGRDTPFLCGGGRVVDTIGELLRPEG